MNKEDKKPKQKVFNQRWLKYNKTARGLRPFVGVFVFLTQKQQAFIWAIFSKIDQSLSLDMQIDILEATKYDRVIDITTLLNETNLRMNRTEISNAFLYVKYSFWLDKETPINPPKESALYGKKSIVINQPLFYQLTYGIIGDPGKQRQYCFYKINPLFIKYFGATIKRNFATLKLDKVLNIKSKLTIIFNFLITKIFKPSTTKNKFLIKVKEFLFFFNKNEKQLKKLIFNINSKIIEEFNKSQNNIKVIKVIKIEDNIQITMHHKYLDPNFRKKLN